MAGHGGEGSDDYDVLKRPFLFPPFLFGRLEKEKGAAGGMILYVMIFIMPIGVLLITVLRIM